MAAALRSLRRHRLLPYALLGPLPKLHAAAAASLPSMRGVNSSPPLVSSVLRRYCSASTARGGGTAIGLAPVRQAHFSPMPMRHHGCTKGAAPSGVPSLRRRALYMPRRAYYPPEFNSLQQCSDEEAACFLLQKLQAIDKTLEQLKRVLVLQAFLVVLFLHLLFRKVAALGEKIGKLERRRY
ncbi:uncharacterized protein [Lolium perenne]|uniref:uncharacterized protein n=1 Tax=Lolium perenne TaxID=4522 RepID=UPI0021F605EF|nr:uncharacterized protein LOC127341764 [Lolium perenne]